MDILAFHRERNFKKRCAVALRDIFHDQKTLQNALGQTAHEHEDVNAADTMLILVLCAKSTCPQKACKGRSPKYNMPLAHLRPTTIF